MEEVARLVKGERRARTKRTATARDEYPGDQRTDRLGPQDDSQVICKRRGWSLFRMYIRIPASALTGEERATILAIEGLLNLLQSQEVFSSFAKVQ